ncbi:hypothetical protein F4780DRAFT_766533, partial [Xylariomycetidae sp. FL0641]
MGGLIVKEAYMQGQNDPEYEEIVRTISAIIFLSTPHRGTSLAQTLNRILDTAVISNSKQYVADLVRNSLTLQKLNEQFRHIAPRLDIVSFYETLPTPLALKSARVIVLEKDSSVLGYPGEVSKALNADHHGVCKYEDRQDPNYIVVRNVLKSLMARMMVRNNSKRPELSDRRASLQLKALLHLPELPGVDYTFFRDQWTEGTNEWILHEKHFAEWQDSLEPQHQLLWLSGSPATGKSVLVSFIINHLVERGRRCQYFFIKFGDRRKRTLSLLIRSLAFQITQAVPELLESITELSEEGVDFEAVNPNILWSRIFKSVLFRFADTRPLYWVIDGLDEAENPRALVKMLSEISASSIPVRIVMTSRRTSEITSAFEKLPKSLKLLKVSTEGHLDDFRQYVDQELTAHGSSEFQAEVRQKIIEASEGNFLWVRLTIERINQCHTESDVQAALQELPEGMEALYHRMARHISMLLNPGDKSLAKRILQYVTCSTRTLNSSELSQALEDATINILDFSRAAMDLCGGFVVFDNSGNVAMAHQTAREYLLKEDSECRPFSVEPGAAHKEIFLGCMRCLMKPGLRARLNRGDVPLFVDYAASAWSSHLTSASPQDEETASTLRKFLTGNWVLVWIHTLAHSGHLRVLAQSSRDLANYSKKRRNIPEHSARDASPLENELFDSWSVDFLRILGKFGSTLRRKPDTIYKAIPPFCPKSSSIYQQFGKHESRNLAITGLSMEKWDDSLARLNLDSRHSKMVFASSVIARGLKTAVLVPSGCAYVFESSDLSEAKSSPIEHGERVQRMQLNKSATLIATYGYRTIKVWELSTGTCKVSVDSPESKTRPLCMAFVQNSSTILIGTDDRRIRSLHLESDTPSLELVAELDEVDLEEHFANAASHLTISNDGTLAAVAYRRYPLSAWEIDGPIHVGHCHRKNDAVAMRELRALAWHPHLPQLIGINLEGFLFKWSPYEDEVDEVPASATVLSLSHDGEVLATGNSHGAVRLYATATLTLLYQVSAQNPVFGLEFSPDTRRIYDLRGDFVNIWEPNVLVRLTEQYSKDADSVSETYSRPGSQGALSVLSGAVDPVTVVAGSPKGRFYSFGTERGVVNLHDVRAGRIGAVHVSRSKFAIEHLIWGEDGRHLCFVDTSKQLTILSVSAVEGSATPSVEQRAAISMRQALKTPIIQIISRPDASQLMVATATQVCTISLQTFQIEAVRAMGADHIHKWAIHPENPQLTIGVSTQSIHVVDWNLTTHHLLPVRWPVQQPEETHNQGDAPGRTIEQALTTRDNKHILLRVTGPWMPNGRHFYFFQASQIQSSAGMETAGDPKELSEGFIDLKALAQEDIPNISVALAFLWKDRLCYISKSSAICHTQIQWGPMTRGPGLPTQARNSGAKKTVTTRSLGDSRTQELFTLPGDWVTRGSQMSYSLWAVEKSLLCPKNGEVAAVKCAGL